MSTCKEADPTSGKDSGQDPLAQEDPAGEQPCCRTTERRHVDALLDVSEELELEPHDYQCYSGWEEAVRGWARVAPLSCILLNQKRYRKIKLNPASPSADPTQPNAESSASVAEHRCESHTGPSKSFKNGTLSKQQTGSWTNSAVAALQADASHWTVLSDVQKTASHVLLGAKTEEEETPSCRVSENRPTKPLKHSRRPNSTVVPIKNFTFLPPIKSPHLNSRFAGQLCNVRKASEGEAFDESGFTCDTRSVTRGAGLDAVANIEFSTYSAALTSKYQPGQHNLSLFSPGSVSVPKRLQVPVPKPDKYSLGRSLHSTTAVGAQGQMQPGYLFS